jgi:mannose-6-phosphate isomerase-like protein (cupin superfamily)
MNCVVRNFIQSEQVKRQKKKNNENGKFAFSMMSVKVDESLSTSLDQRLNNEVYRIVSMHY